MCVLQVEQQSSWVFDLLLDALEEGDGFTAIDQSVVVSKGDIHHWSNLDFNKNDGAGISLSHLNFAVDSDGSIKDTVHAENAGLRRVDDGRSEEGAKDATVGDGESAAFHVFNSEVSSSCEAGESGEFSFNLG